MKKTTRKTASKPRTTKATKNLEVKPAKGGTVRGGDISIPHKKATKDLGVKPAKGRIVRGGLTITKHIDKASSKLYESLN